MTFAKSFALGFGATLGIQAALLAPVVVVAFIAGWIGGADAADQAAPTGFGVIAEMVEGAVPIATLERLCDDRPVTGLSFTR